MPSKPSKARADEKPPGILGGIPLGSALDVFDGIGSFLFKTFLRRYEVEEKIEQVKADAKAKAQELRQEAIKTGYEVKKAFFRAIVEAMLLATGLLALILGLIQLLQNYVKDRLGLDPAVVLVAYGVLILAYIAFKMKTKP
jgi:hypothetical protein